MPESHLNFVYKLEGDVREVDIFKLAPTTLALGELIQESNKALYPEGKEIGVNVKPFCEGSFIVDLSMFPQSHLQQLLEFFTPHSLEQLKTLLEVIGLTGGGATGMTVGAVKVIKVLRGKPKTVEEVKPGEFRITTIDDRSITVGRSVKTLLSNNSITNNIYKIYANPLEEQPNVKDVKTYLREDEAKAITVSSHIFAAAQQARQHGTDEGRGAGHIRPHLGGEVGDLIPGQQVTAEAEAQHEAEQRDATEPGKLPRAVVGVR